jgi:uncharacterized protein (TIGR03435 family)
VTREVAFEVRSWPPALLPPEELQGLETASADAVPDALEKIGLLLRARRAPLDVLVNDHVDRVATDN